jgi:indole-3-glycerol phosphate synthase
MQDKLRHIVAHKYQEVQHRKALYPIAFLESSEFFTTQPVSLKEYLHRKDKSGIIAEFKRQSPSKGIINASALVERVSVQYMQAGASALSILTDTKFFGGSNADLITARTMNYSPILRKDFIIDEYQVIESKSIGADAILLIAAILEKETVHTLATLAKQLGMQVLFEIHTEEELNKLSPCIDLVGVNNRDLKSFETNLRTSFALAEAIPDTFVRVAESGITSAEEIHALREAGYTGFLIGELFMKQQHPGRACHDFITTIQGQEYAC